MVLVAPANEDIVRSGVFIPRVDHFEAGIDTRDERWLRRPFIFSFNN